MNYHLEDIVILEDKEYIIANIIDNKCYLIPIHQTFLDYEINRLGQGMYRTVDAVTGLDGKGNKAIHKSRHECGAV